MGFLDVLNHYAGNSQPGPDTNAHFDEVARAAPPESLGGALAGMFRSNATPSFGQTMGSLFGQSNPQQRAGVLNEIIQALGPGIASGAAGGVLGKILGNTGAGSSMPATVTPQQASQLSPADMTAVATHAEQQNPSVVDRVGAFYAQHPTLVKTLGVTALAVAMGQMQRR